MIDRLAALGTKVPHIPVAVRRYGEIGLDDFCLAEELGAWAKRTEIGGFVILDFDRAILVRGPSGACFATWIYPTDPSIYWQRSEAIAESE